MSQKVVKERRLLLVVFLSNMDIEEFNYDLPEELIAQTPLENRSASRLMVVDKKTGKIKHETFKNIVAENEFSTRLDEMGNPQTTLCKDKKGFAIFTERVYTYFE